MSTTRVLARLLAFLRPFAGLTGLSVLLSAGTVASAIGLLGTSAYLIAHAALHPSIAELQVAIVGVRFFGIARGVLRYLERLVGHDVNFRLLAGLRAWFYQTVEPLAPAGLQDTRAGDLLSRVTGDIDTLENFYVRAVAPPAAALVVTVGVGLWVGQWDAALGLTLVGGLLLSGTVVPLLARRLVARPGQALVAARARQSEALVEGAQGLADILAYGQGGRWLEQVSEAGRRSREAQTRMAWVSGLSGGLNGWITQATLVAALAVGIPLAAGGQMEGALLAVIALATLAAFEATTPLAQAGQQLESSLAAARRLFEMAEREPVEREPIKPGLKPENAGLVVRGLTFRYAPDLPPALVDFDLELPVGKRVALVGASGAGKSTFIRLLLRFWEPSLGTVWLGGRELRHYGLEETRALAATVEQNPYLYTATVRQNLRLARPGATDGDLRAVLALAGLDEWLAGLPEGMDTWLGEHGAAMSAGERQRLALARVLLRDAPILALDEPEAHLDAINEARLLQTLERATRGKSLILVTHCLRGLNWLDEIVVLKGGRVVERGAPAQLLTAGGEYARLRRLQNAALEEAGELS